jgi:hypothetical protein
MRFIKNIVIVLFLFVSIAGSAQKAEYDVINDFLDTELSKITYDSIYVIEKPLERDESIKMYEKSFNERSVNNKHKETWVIPEIENWPVNKDEINLLKKELEKEDKNWKLSDFKNQSFIVYPEELIRSRDFIISHTSAKKYVFNLSRPVLNKEKDFAVFQFYPSYLIGGASSDLGGLILMKKDDKKWIQVAVIQYAVYN